VSMCLSGCPLPHFRTIAWIPDVTLGNGRVPCSSALLVGFAIGARVSLL